MSGAPDTGGMKNGESHRAVRVLLVEDSLPVRQRIRSLIEESGHGTVVGEAGSVAYALALFRTLEPDVVVLDLHLAEGSGYTVLEEIKQTHPDCEVIVLTNFAIPEYQERCRALGADHFFEKSTDFERVPGVLAGVGRAGKRAGRILIADDEELVGEVLMRLLQAGGYECEWVPDAAKALQALNRSRFDLLIADINMPGNRHLELMRELPRVAPGLPVVLMTGDPNLGPATTAVRLHAKAYLSKPPDLMELKVLVQESIGNYRVHQAVQRKWDQFQSLSLELNRQLAVPGSVALDLTELRELDNLFGALTDVVLASRVNTSPDAVQVVQHLELVNAVHKTISVLEKTKHAFKSKQLGNLRTQLETLVCSIGLADAKKAPCSNAPTAGQPSVGIAS